MLQQIKCMLTQSNTIDLDSMSSISCNSADNNSCHGIESSENIFGYIDNDFFGYAIDLKEYIVEKRAQISQS